MGKLLSFVLLAVIAWFAWRAWRRLAAGAAERGPGAAEDMVRCAQCGVHLPRSEGVAAGGDFFCSEEHRRLRR